MVINADDFGWNEYRDKGIIEMFENKHISSATALVNGYNFVNAIKIAKEKRFPIGLHINLTEG